MSYEEFLKRISDNWLDIKEAKVYVTLAKSGSTKASDLARQCDLSRMDTYRILHRLEEKGIVETVIGRPMKFQSIPPEKAFDTLLRSASEKILSMESEKNYLLSLWPSQPVMETLKKDAERLRIIQGRIEFNNTLRRQIKKAQKEILIVTTRNGLYRLFHTGFDKDIEEKAKKGIPTRILCKISDWETETVEKFTTISNIRYPTRQLDAHIFIIDTQEVIMSTSLDDSMSLTSEKDTSLWLNSREHIAVLEKFFEEFWNNSLDIKTARTIIETGGLEPQVRKIVGLEKISSLKNNLINSAKTSITLLTRSLSNSPFIVENGQKLLMSVSKKGVNIKLLTSFENESTSIVEDLEKQFDVKVTNIDLQTDIMIIDSSSIISFNVLKDPNQFEEREAFFIMESAYGSLMDKFFQDTWGNSDNVEDLLKSRKWFEYLQSIIQRAGDILSKSGFDVKTPGIVTNSKSLTNVFDLVASKKNKSREVAVHHLISAKNAITFYAEATQSGVHKVILLTPENFPEESLKLATFFGMETLDLTSTDDDCLKIANAVKEYLSEN